MNTGFVPSIHGWHFDNDFPEEPDFYISIPFFPKIGIGDASKGLCGGFAYAALDYYLSKVAVPADTTVPSNDSDLFHFLYRRLVDSFDLPWGAVKYYEWMASSKSLIEDTKTEASKLVDALSERPVPIGMIRSHSTNPLDLGDNHQMLAIGYEEKDDGLVFSVYDPNYANNDTVTLTLNDKLVHSEDGEVRGFFITRYSLVEVEGV